MRSLIIVFGVLMLIISLPAFFLSTHDARTQDYTETFAGVSTGAGVFTANITLGQDIFDDDVTALSGISSNVSSDTPAASTFNSVSRALKVGGLDESQTRTLSVVYDIESSYIPAGASIYFSLAGWFMMFTILGMIAGAIYAFFD